MELKQKNTRDYSKFTWPYANWSEFSAQRSILMSLTDMFYSIPPAPTTRLPVYERNIHCL